MKHIKKFEEMNSDKEFLRYKCGNCGNTCLVDKKPKECVCNKPDWKLMKNQTAYKVGGKDYLHPEGEI